MYGKIFDSMYEGTLYGQWQAIVTLQQMIVLCDADGIVDMTPPAIAARTSIPLEIITKGIEILSAPDPYSRTEGSEGRRIELIDAHRPWGWILVNHAKYKAMVSHEAKRDADRIRIAAKRKAEKDNQNNGVANSRKVSQPVAEVAHTDTDTDTNTNTKPPSSAVAAERFGIFWQAYPIKVEKKKAFEIFKRLKVDAEMLAKMLAAIKTQATGDKWQRGFIPHPTTWLNGQRFNDELPAPAGAAPAPQALTCTHREGRGEVCGMPAKNYGGVIECEGHYTKRVNTRGMPAEIRKKLNLASLVAKSQAAPQ